MKKRTVSALFAGIGGFDLGFKKAGFKLQWANDYDKYACKTYEVNVGKHIHHGDINELWENVPKTDILIGGFPCQPFSIIGKRKGFEDDRGNLFWTILKIIKKNKPSVVCLENVRNLIHHDEGNTFKTILKLLDEEGYHVVHKVLDTQNFGIPHRRKRIFITCFDKDKFDLSDVEKFEWPKEKKLTKTCQDLLDEEVEGKYFLTKKISKTILSHGTKGYIVKPTIDNKIAKTLTATMHKMHRASQDNYVTDELNFERNVSDKDMRIPIRKITPNECRKLQGLPEKWIQVVSDTQAFKQFGNAVSMNVSTLLAKSIKEMFKYEK